MTRYAERTIRPLPGSARRAFATNMFANERVTPTASEMPILLHSHRLVTNKIICEGLLKVCIIERLLLRIHYTNIFIPTKNVV